jgi:hypothetical protein
MKRLPRVPKVCVFATNDLPCAANRFLSRFYLKIQQAKHSTIDLTG